MKINLLPPPPPALRIRVWLFTVAFAALFAAVVYCVISWTTNRSDMTNEQQLLSQQQLELADIQGQWSKLQQEQSNLNLVKQMEAIRSGSGRASKGLSAVFRDLSHVAIVDQLSFTGGSIALQTTYPSLVDAANNIRVFQHDKMFSSVTVTMVSSGGATASTTNGTSTSSQGSTPQTGVTASFSIQLAGVPQQGGQTR